MQQSRGKFNDQLMQLAQSQREEIVRALSGHGQYRRAARVWSLGDHSARVQNAP